MLADIQIAELVYLSQQAWVRYEHSVPAEGHIPDLYRVLVLKWRCLFVKEDQR
jgi:hypothetical protein